MKKADIYQYLDDRGIAYEITEHEAVYNMAEVALLELPYPEVNAKNLFVRDKKHRFYMITVHGDVRVDLKAFRKARGWSGVSFATTEELKTILDLIPGAVTPFGLLNDEERQVELYIDESFLGGKIGLHPNDNTATVWMAADDLVALLRDHGHLVHPVRI